MNEKAVKTPTAATLKKWANMTDANHHRAVRVDIAEYFGYKDLNIAFKLLQTLVNMQGHITFTQSTDSNYLTSLMIERIGNDYGEETARKVNNCM